MPKTRQRPDERERLRLLHELHEARAENERLAARVKTLEMKPKPLAAENTRLAERVRILEGMIEDLKDQRAALVCGIETMNGKAIQRRTG